MLGCMIVFHRAFVSRMLAFGCVIIDAFSMTLTSHLLAPRYHNLNVVRSPKADLAHIEEIKRRFMTLRDVFSLRDFISGWFFRKPWDELRLDNFYKYAAYALYSSKLSELGPQVLPDGPCCITMHHVLHSSALSVLPRLPRRCLEAPKSPVTGSPPASGGEDAASNCII